MTRIKATLSRDIPDDPRVDPSAVAKLGDLLADDPNHRLVSLFADDQLVGLVCLGLDEDGTLTLFHAQSWLSKLAPMAFRSMLTAAQLTGSPMRVHAEKAAVMARAMGLANENWCEGIDGDGVRQLIFGAA